MAVFTDCDSQTQKRGYKTIEALSKAFSQALSLPHLANIRNVRLVHWLDGVELHQN